MLGALRKRKNSPIITFLLGLTALLMIGFGVSFQGLSSAGSVAHVNGDPISELDFNARYRVTYREKQGQDRRYDRTRAEKEGLREQVLNSMVVGKLLSQKGAEIGLAIDDQALRSAIIDDPRFQTNGQFDRNLYERVLSYLGLTDRRFETQYREELLARPISSLLQTVGPSEAEVRARFERDETTVNVSFVQLEKAKFADQVGQVAPADVEKWRTSVEDPDQEIQAYYTKNKRTKYDLPKRVCAQHVLVKSPKEAPPDVQKQHEARIKEALAAVKSGTDFGEVAKKYSDDSTASTGGSVGCFGPGQMVQQFEQAAFKLEPGQHSGVVKSPFGFHIINVTEVKPAVQKKLEDVKDEIAAELAKGTKAGELAKAQAEAVLAEAQKHPDLDAAVKALALELTVDKTGPFPQSRTFLPKLGPATEVIAAAWKLTEEAPLVEAPIETERAWVVMRFEERTEPDDDEYEEKKKFIVFRLTREKQEQIVESYFEELRKTSDTTIDPVAIRYDDEAQAIRQARRNM